MDTNDITGVILAGGKARRMGGNDKGLLTLGQQLMVQHVIERLRPQVREIIINANRNQQHYQAFGFNLVPDELSGYGGPLAGIASSLKQIETDYMVSAPCDSPFIPPDLVSRLAAAMQNKNTLISVAHNGDRLQPVFCLLKKSLLPSLNDYLTAGERKIDRWFEQHDYAIADFSDQAAAFNNINTPHDLAKATKTLNENNA